MIEAQAQDSIDRITPLSADLATHCRTRTLTLQKLHRICRGVKSQGAAIPWVRVYGDVEAGLRFFV